MYILALDQGTTSSRAIVFDSNGQIHSSAQQEFTQFFPQPGWVEHDPKEIWNSQLETALAVLRQGNVKPSEVSAVGIANQRETTIVWDANTGEPIYPAIVWQDRRTSEFCAQLVQAGAVEKIRQKTGLVLDAYFSASKIRWILDNVPGARTKANQGDLRFGTVDSWLIWNLTKGQKHITDVSNASRTLLFNIHTLEWDDELLRLFDIPASMLPTVCDSSGELGVTQTERLLFSVPISGAAGDQQAALFGQLCLNPGMVKTTYGTGCFLMVNTGENVAQSTSNLLSTVAWRRAGKTYYALEGSVFVGGAVVQWIRDGLKLESVRTSADIEPLAATVPDSGGVYFVPALTGLGAPWWNSNARGGILGITRGTTTAHIARAALEGIAFQVNDVTDAMEADLSALGLKIDQMRVDGGATADDLLMQIQADLFQKEIVRPTVLESTARGAAYLAGLGVGFWNSEQELARQWAIERTFKPQISPEQAQQKIKMWKKAVSRCLNWAET